VKRDQHLASPSRTSRTYDLAIKSADRRGSTRSSGMEHLPLCILVNQFSSSVDIH
jgi:hypothetical protein